MVTSSIYKKRLSFHLLISPIDLHERSATKTLIRQKYSDEYENIIRRHNATTKKKIQKKSRSRPSSLPSVELFDAQLARPRTFGRSGQRRVQAVHVVPAVAVVTKQQLILKREGSREKRSVVEDKTDDALTSLSLVPQTEQHLHSMHCQRYLRTETIMLSVNCKHVG